MSTRMASANMTQTSQKNVSRRAFLNCCFQSSWGNHGSSMGRKDTTVTQDTPINSMEAR